MAKKKKEDEKVDAPTAKTTNLDGKIVEKFELEAGLALITNLSYPTYNADFKKGDSVELEGVVREIIDIESVKIKSIDLVALLTKKN